MAYHENKNTEPPIVLKMDAVRGNVNPPLVTLAAPQPSRKPRPGLFEAILWCVVFLCVQILASLFVAGVTVSVYALQSPDLQQYLFDQVTGLWAKVSERSTQATQTDVPLGMGQALAYGMLGAQFASLGLILLVLPWRVGRDWKRQIGLRRPSWVHVLLVVLVVPGFMMISSGLQELYQELTGLKHPEATQALNGVFRTFPWFFTFLAVGFGPGLVEEIWCRGFLGRGLSARFGIVIGVGLTSMLFGLLHLDPALIVPIAFMGAYLHFVYLASRSIWVSILLHTLNNSIAVLATLTGALNQLEADPHGLTRVIYLTSFSLVLFGSIALWTSRARVVPIQGNEGERSNPTNWKPEYPGISAPPSGSGFRLGRADVSQVALMLTLVSFTILIYLLST